MKLKNAARFFDSCPVYDAYTGGLLFKVQTSTFLESAVEGSTAARRVISVDPALAMPAHSCILALDQILIVGASNPDEWAGTAIRKAYWTKLVTDNFKLLTPGEAAQNLAGSAIFGSKKFLRESLNNPTDSTLDPVWEISLSAGATAVTGYFLKSANTLYRVRMAYNDLDGFKTCQSDEVDHMPTSVGFVTATYNPVTDSYVPTYEPTTGILLDYHKAYAKSAITEPKFEQGDLCLIVAKSAATPAVGKNLQVYTGKHSGVWRVLAVLPEHDSWNLHIRRT